MSQKTQELKNLGADVLAKFKSKRATHKAVSSLPITPRPVPTESASVAQANGSSYHLPTSTGSAPVTAPNVHVAVMEQVDLSDSSAIASAWPEPVQVFHDTAPPPPALDQDSAGPHSGHIEAASDWMTSAATVIPVESVAKLASGPAAQLTEPLRALGAAPHGGMLDHAPVALHSPDVEQQRVPPVCLNQVEATSADIQAPVPETVTGDEKSSSADSSDLEAQLAYLQAEVERLRNVVAEVGANKAELTAHVAALSSGREALEAEVQRLREQLEERAQSQAVEARTVEVEMMRARQAQEALAAEVEELKELQQKTKEELLQWEVLHSDLRAQLQSKDCELKAAQEVAAELKQLREQLGEDDVASLVARAQQTSVLEVKYEKLKEEGKVRFERLKEQSNHRKLELMEARQQLLTLAHEKATLEAQLQTVTLSMGSTLERLQQQMEEAIAERDTLRASAGREAALATQVDDVTRRADELQAALDTALKRADSEAGQRATVEATLAELHVLRSEEAAAAESRHAKAIALAESQIAQLQDELEAARLEAANAVARITQLAPLEVECTALRENVVALESRNVEQAAELQRLTEMCGSQRLELLNADASATSLHQQLEELRLELALRPDAAELTASAVSAAEAAAQVRHEEDLAAFKSRVVELQAELSRSEDEVLKERAQLAKGKAAFRKAKDENQRLKEELAKAKEDVAAASSAAAAAEVERAAASAGALEEHRIVAARWQNEAVALTAQLMDIQTETANLKRKLEASETIEAELRSQVKTLTSDNEQFQQQYSEQADAQDQMEAQLIQQAAELSKQRSRLQVTLDKLTALEKDSAAALVGAQQAAESTAVALSAAEARAAELEVRASSAEALVEVRSAEVLEAVAAADSARSEVAALQQALVAAEAQTVELQEAEEALKSQAAQLIQQVAELEQKLDQQAGLVTVLETKLSESLARAAAAGVETAAALEALTAAETQLSGGQQAVAELQSRVAELEGKLVEQSSRMSVAKSQFTKMKDEKAKMKERIADLEAQVEVLSGVKATLETQLVEAQVAATDAAVSSDQIERLQERCGELMGQLMEAQTTTQAAEQRAEVAEQRAEAAEAQVAAEAERVATLQTQLQDTRKASHALEVEVEATRAAQQAATEAREAAEVQVLAFSAQLESSRNQVAALKEALCEQQEEMRELQCRVGEAESSASLAAQRLDVMQSELEVARLEAGELREKLEAARPELQALAAEVGEGRKQLETQREQMLKLQMQLEAAQQAAESTAVALSAAETRAAELEVRASSAEALVEVRSAEVVEAVAAADSARSEAEDVQLKLEQLRVQLDDALAASTQAVAEWQLQAEGLETVAAARGVELAATQVALEGLQSEMAQLQLAVATAEGRSAELQATVDMQEAAVKALREEVAQTHALLLGARQELHEAQCSAQLAAERATATEVLEQQTNDAVSAEAPAAVVPSAAEDWTVAGDAERLQAALADGGCWDAGELVGTDAVCGTSVGALNGAAEQVEASSASPEALEIQALRQAVEASQGRVSELESQMIQMETELEEAQTAAMDAADAADRCELLHEACKVLRGQLDEAQHKLQQQAANSVSVQAAMEAAAARTAAELRTQLDEACAAAEASSTRVMEVEGELRALEAHLEEAQAQLVRAETDASEKLAALQERLQQALSERDKAVQDAEAVARSQADKVASLSTEIAAVREAAERETAALQVLRLTSEEVSASEGAAKAEMHLRCEQLESELTASQVARSELQLAVQALRKGNEHCVSELRELQATLVSERAQLAATTQRAQELEQRIAVAVRERDEALAASKETPRAAILEQRVTQLEAELCRIRNDNEELEGRCLGQEVLSQQRMEQLQQSNKELRHLQEHNKVLEVQLADAVTASRSAAEAQNAVEQLRRLLEDAGRQATASLQRSEQLEAVLQEEKNRAGGLEQQLMASYEQLQQLQVQLQQAHMSRFVHNASQQEIEALRSANERFQQQYTVAAEELERLRGASAVLAAGGGGGESSGAAAVGELRRQLMELQSERTVLVSRANQVDGLLTELEAARQARVQLETALRVEQRRTQAAVGVVLPPGLGGAGGSVGVGAGNPTRNARAAADKKRDEMASHLDGVYDPENAVLQGASTTFQPLSGLLRGNCPPFASSALGVAARLHDKLTVALYCRPTARLLFSAYILLLHLLVLV